MATYKTPGVSIEEIAKLPPSIAEVATAIPAFIGYTQITNKDADGIHPVRITSLMEYEATFGKTAPMHIYVAVNDIIENGVLKNRTVGNASIGGGQEPVYTLYYHLKLYFANGGGPCYIISVGTEAPNTLPTKADLLKGLAAAALLDEPTILVIPEAENVQTTYIPEIDEALEAYDAAEEAFGAGTITQAELQAAYQYYVHTQRLAQMSVISNVYNTALDQCAAMKDRFLIVDTPHNYPDLLRDSKYGIGPENLSYAAAYYPSLNTGINYLYDEDISNVGHYINGGFVFSRSLTFLKTNGYDDLYNIGKNAFAYVCITLPPCSAIAGVYASVDRTRGVWKAPANVSLNLVTGVTTMISDGEQENLNIDPVGGKSINAIRTFTGKGTLVWGARTLAGNDNEWRYISVRRFFNMVEESVKKAVESFVFEANDANTWVKVQAMIENYLVTLWREGALQGAKPEHAFYVSVGLGKTMTPQDILEGRMYVELGMAAVRPAEFIVLRFSHMMAAS